MACSGCNKDLPIQNKKYNLCSSCVFEKNHGGKSRGEVYMKRASERPIKIYQLKSSGRPRQQTKKEAVVKNELSALKTQIDLEAIQSDSYYCSGCGVSYVGLDHSHILSVGQFKELELDRENIDLLCRDDHMAWESGEIDRQVKLLCFERYLQYIQSKSSEFYSKLLHKMSGFLIYAEPTDPQAQKIRKYFKNNC